MSQQFLLFGPFRLDAANHALYKSGVPVSLTPKEFDTLRVLVENQGRVVAKEELIGQVWPGTFVGDTSLARNISVLRKALGEGFIETVPKRGYRFVAPVEDAPVASRQSPAEAPAETPTVETPPVETRGPSIRAAFPDSEERETAAALPRDDTPKEVAIEAVATGSANPHAAVRRFTAVAAIIVLLGTAVLATSLARFRPQEIRSVAVVESFAPAGDQQAEILSSGAAESVLHALRRVTNLQVLAQHTPVKPGQAAAVIGRQFHTDAILRVETESGADRFHVRVDLLQSRNGARVWEESVTGRLAEAAWVNAEVAEVVARRMNAGPDHPTRRLASSAAFQDYLRGRYFWNKRNPDALQQAFAAFRRAIQEDPDFALAYVGLAQTYAVADVHDARYEGRDDTYREARAAAERAIALDPQLASAHAALAQILRNYDRDMAGAEREYRKALELDPNDATAHQWYAEFLSFNARHEEAIAEIDRARELDPLSAVITAVSGTIRIVARRYAEATPFNEEALRLDPNFYGAYANLYESLWGEGRYAEGLDALSKQAQLAGDLAAAAAVREDQAALRRGGPRAVWQQRLKRLLASRALGRPFPLASLYCRVGDVERCLESLQRSLAERSEGVLTVRTDSAFDVVRGDPRFTALLRQFGFTPAAEQALASGMR